MEELIGEGGRGLGFGLVGDDKDVCEKNLIPNPESQLKKNSDSQFDNLIGDGLEKNSDSEFDDLISSKSELNSDSEFNDLISSKSEFDDLISEELKSPEFDNDDSLQSKWDERLDAKHLRKTVPPPNSYPDDLPIAPDSAALNLVRAQAQARREKVEKARKAALPKKPPKSKKLKNPTKPAFEYNPNDAEIAPPIRTPDTRQPEPLMAIERGQELLKNMDSNFAPTQGKVHEPTIRVLDVRERMFVTYIFNGMPAEEAATKSGYPDRPGFAMSLVGKPHIKEALNWLNSEYLRSIGATLTNIVTQMTHIGFLDPRRVVDSTTGVPIPLHLLDHATAAALESVDITQTEFNGASTITKTRYKFNSKLKALQQLGEHLGLFNQTQKVEITGKDGAPIQMEMSQTEIARRIAFVLQGQSQEITDVDSTMA